MTIENARALQEQLANEAIVQQQKNGSKELADDCIIDYMNLPSEDREKFLPFCTWYEEKPVALAQCEDT